MNPIQISLLVVSVQALVGALWLYRRERNAVAATTASIASTRISLRQARESLQKLQDNYRELLGVVNLLRESLNGSDEELVNLYHDIDPADLRKLPESVQVAWAKGRELAQALTIAQDSIVKVTGDEQA